MKEEDIEDSIAEHTAQLQQVRYLLGCAEDSDKMTLIGMEDDLENLIMTLKDTLLSLKKSNLLMSLSSAESPTSTLVPLEDTSVTASCSTGENVLSTTSDDVFGLKCRAPYIQEWGTKQLHNAMMMCREVNVNHPSLNNKVRVLFTNPTHMSMLPCSHFLDGDCRHSDKECRNSHGHIVSVEDLEEFEEPDFSGLHVGDSCLAKRHDGIWYKASVLNVDKLLVKVSFDTYDEELVLGADNVLPISSHSKRIHEVEPLSSDEDDNLVVSIPSEITEATWIPSSTCVPLGEWEQHTKGFGSKMMGKMGYVVGQGLGKNNHGRVEPVKITVLPAGKSIDMIAQMREKGLLKDPSKKKKPKQKSVDAKLKEGSKNNVSTDVFGFINSRLSVVHTEGISSEHKKSETSTINESYAHFKQRKEAKSKGTHNKGDQYSASKQWSKEVFCCHEEITALKRKLKKHKEAVTRNIGRDSAMVSRLKQAISLTENQIHQLEQKEKEIQQKLNRTKQHKKLSVF